MRPANIYNLQPGAVLAKAVYNNEANILLDKKIKLNDKYIARIKEIGVRTVFIEDEISEGIFIKDVIDEDIRIDTTKIIRKFLKLCETVKDYNTIKFDFSKLYQNSKKIVEEFSLRKEKIYVPVIDVKNAENYTAAHSVNTGLIALAIGFKLNYNKEQLTELLIGSILHDVGKSKIPHSILDKPGRLTDEEYNTIKMHSNYGFLILSNFNELSDAIKNICLRHHEKANGQGYPIGIKENDIDEYSKICALADVYDALTSDRVYKGRMMPDMAIKIIKGAAGTHFSKKIVDAFLNCAQLYPIGTIVQFLNGIIGIVLQYRNESNFKVRLLTNEKQELLKRFSVIDAGMEDFRVLKTFDDLPQTIKIS